MHLIEGATTKDEQVSRCGQAVRQRLRVGISSPGVEKHRRDSRWGWRWRNESQWASSPRRSNPRGSCWAPFALGSEVDPRITRPSPPPTCYQKRARLKPLRKILRNPWSVRWRLWKKVHRTMCVPSLRFSEISDKFQFPKFPLTPLAQLKFLKLRKFQNLLIF